MSDEQYTVCYSKRLGVSIRNADGPIMTEGRGGAPFDEVFTGSLADCERVAREYAERHRKPDGLDVIFGLLLLLSVITGIGVALT